MLFQGCRHWVEPLRYLGRKRNPPLPGVSQMPPKEPQAPRTRIKTLLCRTCREGNTQQPDSSSQGQGSSDSGKTTSQTYGGQPIVGVVSASKKESIRVFNKKNHYNQWQFIYDPNSDRGGLLNTPAQPPLQGVAPQVGQTGQPGQPTTTGPGIQLGTSPQNPAPQPVQPQQPQQQQPPEQ